jgi:pimeloyl-ACP methyl ester carboxylesterase
MSRASRLGPCLVVALGLLASAPAAGAAQQQQQPQLKWKACGSAANVQCATVNVPRDYGQPNGRTLALQVARSPATDQAHRIGSLFLNFGGPGGIMAGYVEAYGADLFPALNQRFDIIGMDPRGVGESSPAIDCKTNQQTLGIYSEPFPTPFTANPSQLIAKDGRYIARCVQQNPDILQYVSTANVARDLDTIRGDLGEQKLNYLGFSYGTFLGATYASLFPHNYRSMVLDGPVDANRYINDPMQDLSSQTSGFEVALARFLQACAVHQDGCAGFGGQDPTDAYDQLTDRLDATPEPANGYAPDPRPITGDDVRGATLSELYAKQLWPELAHALATAAAGDGTEIRQIADEDFYGRDPDTGAYDPISDRYFTIGAAEQNYSHDVNTYIHAGEQAWDQFPHFWVNNGYVELNYGLYPVKARDAYDGPFKVPNSAQTPLVVATTYDPATPYHGALRLVHDLGNARLLTMRGDGHTAYGNGSPTCIDTDIENYLNTLALPPAGTSCVQNIPFVQPGAQPQAKPLAVPPSAQGEFLHMRPSVH